METEENDGPHPDTNGEEKETPAHSNVDDDSSDEDDFRVPNVPRNNEFRFYEYDYNESKINDILQSIKTLRTAYSTSLLDAPSSGSFKTMGSMSAGPVSIATSSVVPGKKTKTGTFNIKEYQKTMYDPYLNIKTKTNTIARFQPEKPKWDGTMFPSNELLKDIYRIPIADPSGKVITSLGRDLAKDVKPWKPPENDRDLPIPTVTNCSEARMKNLLSHMDFVIEKVEKDFNRMKGDTAERSRIKAQIGADLNNLKREKEKLMREFEAGAKHRSPTSRTRREEK
jgi:hypothetical protein